MSTVPLWGSSLRQSLAFGGEIVCTQVGHSLEGEGESEP